MSNKPFMNHHTTHNTTPPHSEEKLPFFAYYDDGDLVELPILLFITDCHYGVIESPYYSGYNIDNNYNHPMLVHVRQSALIRKIYKKNPSP